MKAGWPAVLHGDYPDSRDIDDWHHHAVVGSTRSRSRAGSCPTPPRRPASTRRGDGAPKRPALHMKAVYPGALARELAVGDGVAGPDQEVVPVVADGKGIGA